MTQEAIKPCPNPFRKCEGSQPPIVTFLDFNAYNAPLRHVVCHNCGLRGPIADTEAEAIAAWNTRTPSPTMQPQGDIKPGTPLEAIIAVRGNNAANFERQGAVWEAYDRAVLDCAAAVEPVQATMQATIDELVEALAFWELRGLPDKYLDDARWAEKTRALIAKHKGAGQ